MKRKGELRILQSIRAVWRALFYEKCTKCGCDVPIFSLSDYVVGGMCNDCWCAMIRESREREQVEYWEKERKRASMIAEEIAKRLLSKGD